MTIDQLVFLLFSAVALMCALSVVRTNNLVHAAFALIGCLFAVAGLFAMLDAGLLVVAQVIIYVGAIATLIVLAVMVTRHEQCETGRQTHAYWPLAMLAALLVLAGLIWGVSQSAVFTTAPAKLAVPADSVLEVGRALIEPQGFMLAFEGASVLLLAALIGAVMIAGGARHTAASGSKEE